MTFSSLRHLTNRLFARPGAAEPAAKPHGGESDGDVHADLPRRVCIINFTGERQNWGCRATSWELVRLLNRHWPADPPFALDVIPLAPHHALDREIATRHLPEIRSALSNPKPQRSEISLIESLCRTRYLHMVDLLERADLVIFQGEGTMTGTDFLRADRLLLLPWLAKHRFGKRVISLNQTLFSADPEFTGVLLKVLAGLDEVWVREPASLAWLCSQGFTRARLVADTAFLTDPLEHGDLWQSLPSDREFFCITGSASLTAEAVEPYIDAVEVIVGETHLFPVFTCSVGLDVKLVEAAARRWGSGQFVQAPAALAYPAVAELLGRARFLVGGRYHLSILAAIDGTPSVLCDTNSHKQAGLRELFGVDWGIRGFTEQQALVEDARRLVGAGEDMRERLRQRVSQIRAEIDTTFATWYATHERNAAPPRTMAPPSDQEMRRYSEINQRIAERFRYPEDDTPAAKLGPPQPILPQLMALTIYLRRGSHTRETFRCLRQLVEGNLDLVLTQLDARWLVSICDSYADFGDPLEARNALLISTFMNWERLAASYIHWAEPERKTLAVDRPIPPNNKSLWDGLITVQLSRGDTTSNLLKRYAGVLEATPHLLRIWRTLLERIRTNDSVMAALNRPHGFMFEESVAWMDDDRYADVPPWRKPGRARQRFTEA